MENKSYKITLELDEALYLRIYDVVNYLRLHDKYKNIEDEIVTEVDFIIGAVKRVVKEVELFSYHNQPREKLLKDVRHVKTNLKHYLKKCDIKQKDLAEAIGMDKAQLNLIVNNNVQPSMESFIKIWSALNFPPIDEIIYRE